VSGPSVARRHAPIRSHEARRAPVA